MGALPKPRPHLLQKQDAREALALLDRAERLECKRRSGGQCEVIISLLTEPFRIVARVEHRCVRRASQNHHLIGGSGRRNKGRSILAAHRLDTCDLHHREIHGHVLRPVDGARAEDASTVRYERLK